MDGRNDELGVPRYPTLDRLHCLSAWTHGLRTMRIFRLGERVKARIPNATQIGTEKVAKWISGQIIGLSPCRKFAKLLLDDDTELLIETRFLK